MLWSQEWWGHQGLNLGPIDYEDPREGATAQLSRRNVRDFQRQAMAGHELEFGHAKGLDGFKPMGPCLVTMDEFPDPLDLKIEARVNGELRQSAQLRDLIHDIVSCVSYISRFHTLRPGYIILTGSPAGVGYFQGSFLKPGDLVEMAATGIGTISNRVVA